MPEDRQVETVWEVDGTPHRRFDGGIIPDTSFPAYAVLSSSSRVAQSPTLMGEWVIDMDPEVLTYYENPVPLEGGECR